LPKFKPLVILRYSATHKTHHNRVHRLDALDAYNQKLVKKIAVRGIQTRGLAGTNAYLYLEGIVFDVRSILNSGHSSERWTRPLCATSGLRWHSKNFVLFRSPRRRSRAEETHAQLE
jgi:hypothetical protein